MRQSSQRLAFWAACLAMTLLYAISATPIPLYGQYATQLGLTHGDLSLTAVAYFAGTIAALLVLARVSDYIGRKPVSLIALGLGGLSCLCFLNAHTLNWIIIGRLLQGLSCGLASSAIAGYIVDSVSTDKKGLGATISGSAPLLGLTLGAFLSVVLSTWLSIKSPFVILLILLVFLSFLFVFAKESVTKKTGVLTSLTPKIEIPTQIRPLLPASLCIFVISWALGGFTQAFSGTLAQYFGFYQSLAAALVFAGYMTANFIGGIWASKQSAFIVQRWGSVLYVLASCMLVGSVTYHSAIGFIISGIAAGMSAGMSAGSMFNGAMRYLITPIKANERAGVFAIIFLTAYSGAGIPNLLIAYLVPKAEVLSILFGYLVFIIVVSLIGLGLLKKPHNDAKTVLVAKLQ